MILKAIAAVNNLGYIGKDGKLMWKSKKDFKHFRDSTIGGILIVGRKTFEVDFGGVGLPGRTCIVIGSKHNTPNQAYQKALAIFNEANEIVEREIDQIGESEEKIPDIWVVGGAQIYKMFMPFIDEFHLSRINDDREGDAKLDMTGFTGKLIEYNFEIDK